jgi:hypothetical protein
MDSEANTLTLHRSLKSFGCKAKFRDHLLSVETQSATTVNTNYIDHNKVEIIIKIKDYIIIK